MYSPTPRHVIILYGLAVAAVLLAAACLALSFLLEDDIPKAFFLGVFFASLVGSVVAFGFARVARSLAEIRGEVHLNRDMVEEIQKGAGDPRESLTPRDTAEHV